MKRKFGIAGILLSGLVGCSGATNMERFTAIINLDGRVKRIEDAVYPKTFFSERRREIRYGNKIYYAVGDYDQLEKVSENGNIVYKSPVSHKLWHAVYFVCPWLMLPLAPIDMALNQHTERNIKIEERFSNLKWQVQQLKANQYERQDFKNRSEEKN